MKPASPAPLVSVDLPSGRLHRRLERFPVDLARGRFPIGAALHAPIRDVATLCSADGVTDLEGALFLDTETTGLVGGAGTFVFLVGVATFEGNALEVRQWVLPDPAEEEALLDALEREAERTRTIVSFHGRGFDLPRLEERFLLHGRPFPLAGIPHLDLLVGARRVFSLRAGSVRLQRLESTVLGIERLDDLPGAECPEAWYAYLRGDRAPMDRVLEHNLLDLLSLPPLLASLGRAAVGDGPAEDLHSAGRALARAGREGRALRLQRRASTEAVDGTLAARAHQESARLLRRNGQVGEAAHEAVAATRADPSLHGPWLALAKLAEHVERDFGLALACTAVLEDLVAGGNAPRRMAEDVDRRRRRLERRIRRTAGS